jgi:hypothetical protein
MRKFQITNSKSQINSKSQCPKLISLEFEKLEFGAYLEYACLPLRQGAWCLEFIN